jgi:CHAT domain-containing protein
LKPVVDALSEAEAAHIAAHAWFDQSDPLASGILLAGGEVLDARRAMHEKLQLRLLVLSACSTGQQAIRVSNSASGLARGFLYAGVRQLILSLWPVNDLSTMLLMDRLYEELARGLSVGDALRAAQVELRTTTNAVIARRFAEDRKRAADDRLLDEATVSDLWRRFALAEPDVRPFEHAHYWAPFFVTGVL